MIEIKCDICTLQLKNHVTLLGSEAGIVFDSATHKTHLFKLLQQQQTSKTLSLHKKREICIRSICTARAYIK